MGLDSVGVIVLQVTSDNVGWGPLTRLESRGLGQSEDSVTQSSQSEASVHCCKLRHSSPRRSEWGGRILNLSKIIVKLRLGRFGMVSMVTRTNASTDQNQTHPSFLSQSRDENLNLKLNLIPSRQEFK